MRLRQTATWLLAILASILLTSSIYVDARRIVRAASGSRIAGRYIIRLDGRASYSAIQSFIAQIQSDNDDQTRPELTAKVCFIELFLEFYKDTCVTVMIKIKVCVCFCFFFCRRKCYIVASPFLRLYFVVI